MLVEVTSQRGMNLALVTPSTETECWLIRRRMVSVTSNSTVSPSNQLYVSNIPNYTSAYHLGRGT